MIDHNNINILDREGPNSSEEMEKDELPKLVQQ